MTEPNPDEPTGNDPNTDTSSQQPPPQGDPGGQQQPSSGTEGQQSTEEPEKSDKDYRKLYEQTLEQSRKWESRAKSNADKAKKWDQAEEANKSEAERNATRAEQAETQAKKAVTAAINAEIKASAHGWADPNDAPRYLDDKQRYVGEDGEIDTQAIATDVAAVLKDRPHLARQQRGQGSPDPGQGPRGGVSIADQIRDAENKGDTAEALRLKTEQMLSDRKGGR